MSWTIIHEEAPQSEIIHLKLIVAAGALSDPENCAGLSYLTGQSLLRGTKTRSYEDLVNAIEVLGAQVVMGSDEKFTYLEATLLASSWLPFLSLLQEVLTAPAFDAQELERLKRLTQGELKGELQDPQSLAARALMTLFYSGTRLSLPIAGQVQSIASIKREDVQSFFEKFYVKENMILGVSSSFSKAEITSQISKSLNSIPTGQKNHRTLNHPTLKGRKSVIVEREGLATIPFYLAIPGVSDNDPKRMALDVANTIFGSDYPSRIIRELRDKRGWNYSAHTSFGELMGASSEPGLFSLAAFPSIGLAKKMLPLALELFEEFVKNGVTDEELREAKEGLSKSYLFEVDTAEKRLDRRLRGLMTGRGFDSIEIFRKKLQDLRLNEVNEIIQDRFQLKNLGMAVVGETRQIRSILVSLPFMEAVEVIEIAP
jgi:zinc protease